MRSLCHIHLPVCLLYSVPRSEALVSRDCAHTARATRPLFCKLYFCCLGKHSQTETGFKNELPSVENRETFYFLLNCFDVQIGINTMASQGNISFLKHWV